MCVSLPQWQGFRPFLQSVSIVSQPWRLGNYGSFDLNVGTHRKGVEDILLPIGITGSSMLRKEQNSIPELGGCVSYRRLALENYFRIVRSNAY